MTGGNLWTWAAGKLLCGKKLASPHGYRSDWWESVQRVADRSFTRLKHHIFPFLYRLHFTLLYLGRTPHATSEPLNQLLVDVHLNKTPFSAFYIVVRLVSLPVDLNAKFSRDKAAGKADCTVNLQITALQQCVVPLFLHLRDKRPPDLTKPHLFTAQDPSVLGGEKKPREVSFLGVRNPLFYAFDIQ